MSSAGTCQTTQNSHGASNSAMEQSQPIVPLRLFTGKLVSAQPYIGRLELIPY